MWVFLFIYIVYLYGICIYILHLQLCYLDGDSPLSYWMEKYKGCHNGRLGSTYTHTHRASDARCAWVYQQQSSRTIKLHMELSITNNTPPSQI